MAPILAGFYWAGHEGSSPSLTEIRNLKPSRVGVVGTFKFCGGNNLFAKNNSPSGVFF